MRLLVLVVGDRDCCPDPYAHKQSSPDPGAIEWFFGHVSRSVFQRARCHWLRHIRDHNRHLTVTHFRLIAVMINDERAALLGTNAIAWIQLHIIRCWHKTAAIVHSSEALKLQNGRLGLGCNKRGHRYA